MPTNPEINNQEPFPVPNPVLGLVGQYSSVTTTTPPPPFRTERSIPTPVGLNFVENTDLSNGNLSRQITNYYGINDFSIFNPYIHYVNPNGNYGDVMSELGVGGYTGEPTKIYTMSFLIEATNRFEIYSLKYRGQ